MKMIQANRFNLFILAFLMLSGSVHASWLGNWDPIALTDALGADWIKDQMNAPIVAPLWTASREKSVIVWDWDTIYVLDDDGNELFTLEPEDGYHFLHSPAIGNVIGGNWEEIVVVETKTVGFYTYGMLVVFKSNEDLEDLDYEAVATFVMNPAQTAPGIPVLVDLESDLEGSNEDGKLEILVGNYQPGNITWSMAVYEVTQDGENYDIDEVKRILATGGDNHPAGASANRCPAVADFNRDGLKEIVLATTKRVMWWTYNPDEATRFVNAHSIEYVNDAGLPGYGILGCVGPMIADIDNDGTLWVILPYLREAGQDEHGLGKLIVLDITANNWAGAEHIAYDAAELPRDAGELFPNGLGTRDDQSAVGDFGDVEWNADGHLSICMDLGATTMTSNVAGGHSIFAINSENTEGYWLSIGNVGPADEVEFRLCLMRPNNNHAEAYSISEARMENPDPIFDEVLAGDGCSFGGSVITDLDHDGDMEILYRTTDDADNGTIQIYALETASTYADNNELVNIEWSQLQNGPRHTGLYAQSWGDAFPAGRTYLRDRVIFTEDIEADNDHAIVTFHGRPNVLEFNDGVTLTIHADSWGIELGPYPLVIKGNDDDDEGGIVLADDFLWPPEELGVGEVATVNLNGMVVSVDEGECVTLEDWHFIGDGTNTAISSSGAVINLINCTFRGYATAVNLYDCEGTFSGCTFEDMTGTAIFLSNCDPTSGILIEDCTFTGSSGAAVSASNSVVKLEDNIITENNGDSYGAAVYSYNSTVTLIGNDISDNELVGFKASGGGSVYMTDWVTTFGNRFSENQTESHTAKVDSTWAEMIQVSPAYIFWDKGHNDFINNNGDYLISNHSYSVLSLPFYGLYNYYDVSGTLGSGDFYPYGSVTYSPSDLSPNYTSSVEDEESALKDFITAKQEADSGRYQDAYEGFTDVVNEFPNTAVAASALRMAYDLAEPAGISQAQLGQLLSAIASEYDGTPLGNYGFRLVNLQLVAIGDFADAIENLADAMENPDSRLDSLYYAIDQAYAEMAQFNANDDNEINSAGQQKQQTDVLHKRIDRLMADLNGRPYSDDSQSPQEFGLLEAYPNPFNSTVSLSFRLDASSHVKLTVLDINGREIARLVDSEIDAGVHMQVWNAETLPSGLYFAQLNANGKCNSVKMTLLK